MKLLTLDQADFSSDDVVFREAAAPSAIWTVLATLGAVGLIAWRVYGDLPLIFPLIGVPGLLLFALLTAAQFRKARLNTNWLLAASGRRVLIKYRSYLNTNLRPDDPQVVSLDCAEIRSTGETALSLKVSGSGHDVPERVLIRCLDIVVDCELAPLNERLAYERGLAGYNGATWHDYPESVRDDSTIRIEWKNSYKITRPGVREAMAAIGR
ncbi:MAG TPA: hypothetical protein VEZ90_05485, partial [Blastocatellia bacterium]|nr:hypothetical protein [Blastocatellia bacterium]